MANIVPSDVAPEESVHYTFAGVEFDLAPGDEFESTSQAVLSNAEAHPWLVVVAPPVSDAPEPIFFDQLAPEDDHLSALGGINANDPEVARAAEHAKAEALGLTDDGELPEAPHFDTSEDVSYGEQDDEAPAAVEPTPFNFDNGEDS